MTGVVGGVENDGDPGVSGVSWTTGCGSERSGVCGIGWMAGSGLLTTGGVCRVISGPAGSATGSG